ncbi:hypothetical protein Hypma_009753 [Hypsizygus marmoreus]|uniref:Uncharacterized protein n=1 Tax=Hypsizygus marmoreus TaxID=39966 RepID=A0A369JLP4_HYPMA|nr:hypothetical protein Hypma_009753 [Hypsizygus marmoreus]
MVDNTKSTAVDVKVIDQVPMPENFHFTVKFGLTLPGAGEQNVPQPLMVGEGVVAHWEDTDEEREGTVNLLLSWEMSAPRRTGVAGASDYETAFEVDSFVDVLTALFISQPSMILSVKRHLLRSSDQPASLYLDE